MGTYINKFKQLVARAGTNHVGVTYIEIKSGWGVP
jgi:hypothetical protein